MNESVPSDRDRSGGERLSALYLNHVTEKYFKGGMKREQITQSHTAGAVVPRTFGLQLQHRGSNKKKRF